MIYRRMLNFWRGKKVNSYWQVIRHQVIERIRKVGSSSSSISKWRRKSKSKSKIEISPQEAVALMASIIIIILAFGGMGLVYSVFP